MAKFILAYHGGSRPTSPEAGKAFIGKWKEWVGGLGAAMVNPGSPLGKSKTVSSSGVTEGGGANPLAGYSVVVAGDIDAALAMASASPHLEHGTIEVAEVMSMPMK